MSLLSGGLAASQELPSLPRQVGLDCKIDWAVTTSGLKKSNAVVSLNIDLDTGQWYYDNSESASKIVSITDDVVNLAVSGDRAFGSDVYVDRRKLSYSRWVVKGDKFYSAESGPCSLRAFQPLRPKPPKQF